MLRVSFFAFEEVLKSSYKRALSYPVPAVLHLHLRSHNKQRGLGRKEARKEKATEKQEIMNGINFRSTGPAEARCPVSAVSSVGPALVDIFFASLN